MTKARYHCKRYVVYVPNSIGDALDTSVDYDVRLVDKLIVLTPKQLSDVASTIAKLESESQKAKRENADSAKSSELEDDVEP
jgi:hypothetical protein